MFLFSTVVVSSSPTSRMAYSRSRKDCEQNINKLEDLNVSVSFGFLLIHQGTQYAYMFFGKLDVHPVLSFRERKRLFCDLDDWKMSKIETVTALKILDKMTQVLERRISMGSGTADKMWKVWEDPITLLENCLWLHFLRVKQNDQLQIAYLKINMVATTSINASLCYIYAFSP